MLKILNPGRALAGFLLVALCLFNLSTGAQTALTTTQAHSTARLVFDQTHYQPGQKIRAGLWIELEDHWHTYWVNPGDSGAPVIFDWKLPEGWQAGEIHFPAPMRISNPPIESFGYEGKVLFFTELQAPANSQASVNVELEAEWLVCKDVCIPAVFTFKTSLPFSSDKKLSADVALFEKAERALPPKSNDIIANFGTSGDELTISVLAPEDLQLKDIFPAPKNVVSNKMPGELHLEETREEKNLWRIKTSTSRWAEKSSSKDLLLHFEDPTQAPQFAWVELKEKNSNLLPFLFFAFLGGLILNLMPCVFPIISMKFFALLKHGGDDSRAVIKSNMLYVAGVISSFWLLALILFSLRQGGEALGWGFQLQSPSFVIFLILLFALMAFNFLGWFEIDLPIPGLGNILRKEGPAGDFLTGVLSTVVASPCTAPFMGVSIGFALSQPLGIMLLIFTCLGLGLAFPYIVLSVFPGWARHLPKPGAWMEKIKTFMAFPLLATVVWLAWSLSFQISATSLALVWTSVLVLGLTIWVSRNLFLKSPGKAWVIRVILILIVIWLSFFNIQTQNSAAAEGGELGWQKFTPELVTELREKNLPVFIDFTAAWCITCQVNKQVTFADPPTVQFIKNSNIQMLIADWTNRDPVISKVLDEHQRAGVPLYLFYPAGRPGAPVILPEVLTPSIFKQNIEDHL